MSKYRIKHNKKRNTGLLYFTAVKKITECACRGDPMAKKLTSIMVNAFGKEPIKSELEIYKSVVSEYLKPTMKDKSSIAKFVDSLVGSYSKMNTRDVDSQRAFAAKKIARVVSLNEILSVKIDNDMYKILTSTYVMINTRQKKTIQESRDFVYICDRLTGLLVEAGTKPIRDEDKPMANKLVLDFMIKRFNTKYNDLSPRQRQILKEYSEYILDEESNRDFPLKMMTLVESACDSLKTVKTDHKDIDEMAKKALERADDRREWDTERLVTEAMIYSEARTIIKE